MRKLQCQWEINTKPLEGKRGDRPASYRRPGSFGEFRHHHPTEGCHGLLNMCPVSQGAVGPRRAECACASWRCYPAPHSQRPVQNRNDRRFYPQAGYLGDQLCEVSLEHISVKVPSVEIAQAFVDAFAWVCTAFRPHPIRDPKGLPEPLLSRVTLVRPSASTWNRSIYSTPSDSPPSDSHATKRLATKRLATKRQRPPAWHPLTNNRLAL